MRPKKKVVASMGTVAASGGYYIASGADVIVANPGTLTGSIGVIMNFANVEKLTEKLVLICIIFMPANLRMWDRPTGA